MDDKVGPAGTEESEADVDPAPAVPRRPLDQMRILRAAVEFIDVNGLGKLTMRRLGAHLGVEAMALYRYVPGREQLLDGVVEMVMDELYETTNVGGRSTSWQEYLQMQAHAVRTIAVKHPRIFPLVATRPPSAPWLRPPLRSLRWVESFLQGLHDYGFEPRVSVVGLPVVRDLPARRAAAGVRHPGGPHRHREGEPGVHRERRPVVVPDDLGDGRRAQGRRFRGRVRGRPRGPDRTRRRDAVLIGPDWS